MRCTNIQSMYRLADAENQFECLLDKPFILSVRNFSLEKTKN